MIRKATADDADAVKRIVAAAYAPLAQRMDKPPMPMLDDYSARIEEGVVDVLDEDGVVLGMIILVDYPDAMMLDGSAIGLVSRMLRFSAFVDDGVVKALNVEGAPGEMDATSAEKLLEQI